MTRHALITPCGDDLDDAGLTYGGIAQQLMAHAEEADRQALRCRKAKMPYGEGVWFAVAKNYRTQAALISGRLMDGSLTDTVKHQ
ncbi:hypothetical protein predicted by Glimmer/Critica [Acetobacter senegalensis]|uniref:Uncharacterized protein n=1 Tax=Acetobacter senegalensis TaxID=446692 RepID=A0A0U5B8S5_9PROT|nr:hypothetical protein [Acetobacter senegalensis]CEF40770.1 hypothetical protein predicted by Glimmer/Critica [Acetobacter senegalensis]